VVSSSHNYIHIDEELDLDEAYERVILEFYSNEKPPVIADILIAHEFSEKALVAEHLSELFGKKANITHPIRGYKKDLINLAFTNAKELLNQKRDDTSYEIIATKLKELCSLNRTPMRIECFDNSHISGEASVGGMIVYENGESDKKSYRHYNLDSRDEYAQMRETLTKRVESFEKNPPPDLWVIDGGTTLLSLAHDILYSSGVNIDVIAISKEKIDAKSHRAKGAAHDQIHTIDETFFLDVSDKRLHLVQVIRDEAHRFAISFHKKQKLKLNQESKLLNLKGISQAKIVKLLKHFETFDKLKSISEEEIAEVLNAKDAKIIKEFYN
jgi:excinuclease ABC subunit C